MSDVNRVAETQSKCSHTPGPWKVIPPGHGHPSEYQCVQYGADERYTSLEMLPADARLTAAAPELLQGMKDLYRAYVNLLEAGRDRIATYGGQCDSVETMERGDPWLKKARDVVANAEGRS